MHQGPVGAVAQQEAENPDINCLQQLVKLHRVDHPGVGDRIGDQDNIDGTVVVQVIEGQGKAGI